MDRRRQLLRDGLRPRVAAGAALIGLYLVALGLVLGVGWLLVGLAVVLIVLAAARFGRRGLEKARDPVARADAELRLRVAGGRAAAALGASARAVRASVDASIALAATTARRLRVGVRGSAAAPAQSVHAGGSRFAPGAAGAATAVRWPAPPLQRVETAAAVLCEAAAATSRRWLEQASLHLTAAASTSGERDATTARGDDFLDQALELNRLGSVARREGRREDAIEAHSWALKLVRELGNRREEARTLGNLALALADQDPDAAVARCEQALAIVRELGEARAEGQVSATIAVLHQRAGRTDDAIACWQSALGHFSPGSAEHARIAENLRLARLTHSNRTDARPVAGSSARPS